MKNQVNASEREFYKKLGQKLRNARTARGVSVEDLAAVAEITPDVMTAYEEGTLEIPIYHLIPMLKKLEFPPELDTLS